METAFSERFPLSFCAAVELRFRTVLELVKNSSYYVKQHRLLGFSDVVVPTYEEGLQETMVKGNWCWTWAMFAVL